MTKIGVFLSSQTAFSVLNIMKTIQQSIDEGSSYIFITVVCIYHINSEEIGYYWYGAKEENI